jgi:hypothetical protein
VSRPRRERGAMESLLQIVYLLEVFVIFFAGLVAFGLKVVPWWVVLLGALALVALLTVAALGAAHPWGYIVGAFAQLALVATGILVSLMFVVGTVFVGIFLFCLLKGQQLDRNKAAYFAAQSKENNA